MARLISSVAKEYVLDLSAVQLVKGSDALFGRLEGFDKALNVQDLCPVLL